MNTRLGLRLNTKIAAPTQYLMPFNSLSRGDGVVLAGSNDGLFTLTGGSDDGNDIKSRVAMVTTDFGIPNYKRFRWIQVGYESAEDLELTVSADEGTMEEYTLPARKTDSSQSGARIPIHRTIVGRYFTITVSNPDGVHFTLDSITATINVLPQKPRG